MTTATHELKPVLVFDSGIGGLTVLREAAVLILVHPAADGEAHVILIERAGGDHIHAGQISLPGGAI